MKKNRVATANKNEKGFTLIELMVSVVIFLIAIAAVYQVMRIGTIQRNTINTRVDANKAARISLNYVRRDVINAGLSYHNIGGLVPDNFANYLVNTTADTNTDQDLLTAIVAGNNVNTNSLNAGVNTDSITVVTRDLDFNNGKFVNFTSTSASGSTVVVKTDSRPNGADGLDICKQYDLYLFETANTQVVGMVTAVPDKTTLQLAIADPMGVNLAANGSGSAKSLLIPNTSGTLKKITVTNYKVTNAGTLVRTTYGNQAGETAANQVKTSELIYNVKDFQIKYLLNDGTSVDDPSSANSDRDSQQRMNDVIEVQVTMTVLQEEKSQPQIKSSTVLKEVISTRNLLYTIG